MEEQNYKNHVRYYPPHHFVFYPILMVLMGFSTWFIFKYEQQSLIWIFITLGFFMLGYLAFMLRQHYALNNQNRIVRLELRFRYYVLTGKRLEDFEGRLSQGQLFALRFASDQELPVLVSKATTEKYIS
jgi:hypothetical protein